MRGQQDARQGNEGVAAPVAHDALGEEGEARRDERRAGRRHGRRELQGGDRERRKTGGHLHAICHVPLQHVAQHHHEPAELHRPRALGAGLDVLELLVQHALQVVKGRSVVQAVEEVVEEPVALAQVLQQRVVHHVIPNDLSNLGDHSKESGIGQRARGELVVVLEVGVTQHVHAIDYRVCIRRVRYCIAAPAVQRSLLLIGGEEKVAEVGEGGLGVLQNLLHGCHGGVGV